MQAAGIMGKEVLDRGHFILQQCNALNNSSLLASSFVADLSAAVEEVMFFYILFYVLTNASHAG